MSDSSVQQEGRILLAIQALKKGQIKGVQTAAKTYNVKRTTLRDRLQGSASRTDITANGRKLSNTEESILLNWILSADERGLPPRFDIVRNMASIISQKPIGINWVNRFINRHHEIKTRYGRRYDYQRALCEDSEAIQRWFSLVHNMIAKYGILEQDIYNFDETGFSMGMTSTSKVITSQITSCAKVIQPGNRTWVTVIEAIGSNGFLLPPMIILAAKQHQASWYHNLHPDWIIGVSDTGWTNDNLGRKWLEEVFDKNTKPRTAGVYRLLILDGHGSHATAEFDHFCSENKIICLYLPSHSSHLLQPLDVACFGPLKHLYGQRIQTFMKLGINHIDKNDFLEVYQAVRPQAFTASNINAAFSGAGLIPYNPGRVLDNLHISHTTPPGTPHSKSSSSWTAETPKTTKDLKRQGVLVRRLLERRTASPCATGEAVNQVMKGCEIAMNNALLLEHEVKQLREANQHQKRKRQTPKAFIASGGTLTGIDGQKRVQDIEEAAREVEDEGERPRKRAPPQCTNCQVIGHKRNSCPSRPSN